MVVDLKIDPQKIVFTKNLYMSTSDDNGSVSGKESVNCPLRRNLLLITQNHYLRFLSPAQHLECRVSVA